MVDDQVMTENYALYNGDACEVMRTIPDESVHLSIYSPPFAADGGGCLYHYSSSERDLSNCRNYQEFFDHYAFIVQEVHRVTIPGRLSAVHCMDIPRKSSPGGLIDFPGEIIRLHEQNGWRFWCRHFIWKEPLGVRNRTMARGLAHRQVIDDSSLCDVASADCLLLFRKDGENPVPIVHPTGLRDYAGERQMPAELLQYRGHNGKQTENRYSHWIWRQYASAFWDDIRIDRTLPYKEVRDSEDERHMHPLQLDVIERIIALRSLPGETVLTPFMGVGSEAYGAVLNGRKAIGIELKPTYYHQAVRNLERASMACTEIEMPLFASQSQDELKP
jgi:DNA modification methylase